MFRVRSELFREDVLQALEHTPPMVVDQVLETKPHPTDPARVMQNVSVKPIEQTGEERKTVFTNLSISKCVPICARFPSFFDFEWSLRYTKDQRKTVITADDAIRFEGPDLRAGEPFTNCEIRLYFPLCWQACLIVSPGKLLPYTKSYSPSRLGELRGRYLTSLCRFSYSPVKLDG
jgi:hypothetical protein